MATKYIKDKLSLLPQKPGCYLMKDTNGTIIYVGKAKSLKNRVNSYFSGTHNYKTTKLVSEIVDFDYIVTDSEKEALLLEINLIKDYDPKYNIALKDSSYYPYIQLTRERHPRLKIVRNAASKKHRHFGPFPNATAARETLKLLDRLFKLRKCRNIPKKPCLYYSLGQCMGPCINAVGEEEYKKISKDIAKFVNGDTREVIANLKVQMLEASEDLQFEKAKEIRDLIQNINHVTDKQHVTFNDLVDRDIIGYHVDNGYLSLQLFFMRNGHLLSRDFSLVPVEDDVNDQILTYLATFYQTNTIPRELLVPQDLDMGTLAEVIDAKVVVPQIGKKADLVKMATTNAKEQLEKKFLLMAKNERATVGAMAELGHLLGIKDLRRVELFDNSNIQGSYAVAGMVCFIDGEPAKKEYRKFKIKTVEGPDDYASMREVVYRRYFRVLIDKLDRPELIIVDGGKGQIKAALEVINSLNLDIRVCGLAKDDNHNTAMLLDSNGEEIKINKRSPLFFLLTRMQDEVHRYAISFHRNVRSKAATKSILDDVEGIGPKRRQMLMREFKSLKNLKNASIEDLSKVLPKNTAAKLHDYLKTL